MLFENAKAHKLAMTYRIETEFESSVNSFSGELLGDHFEWLLMYFTQSIKPFFCCDLNHLKVIL